MKSYQIYFIVLKILVVLQLGLVLLKKQTNRSDIFIITDTVFKISVGIYLFVFFIINSFPGLEFGDTVILRFAGAILLFDIDYIGLLAIIRKQFPRLFPTLFDGTTAPALNTV